MLKTAGIAPASLEVLRRIMDDSAFDAYDLVGGAALSMHLGHRMAYDLELATSGAQDADALMAALAAFGTVQELMRSPILLRVAVEGVYVTLLKLPVAYANDIDEVLGIRLHGIRNIALSILQWIAKEGAGKDDLFDICFIMKRYSLSRLLEMITAKFPDVDIFDLMERLTYYEQAGEDLDPEMLSGSMPWTANG